MNGDDLSVTGLGPRFDALLWRGLVALILALALFGLLVLVLAR